MSGGGDVHRLGLTIGDPGGIGPEIVLKAWQMGKLEGARCVIYGSRELLDRADARLANQGANYHSMRQNFLSFNTIDEVDFEVIEARHVPIVEVAQKIEGLDLVRPGGPSAASAWVQLRALERAIEDGKAGGIDAIVTAPWTKELFRLIDHPTTGHTEVLANAFQAPHHVMMLAGPTLRVALATVHVPIKEVSKKLTVERLEQTIRTTVTELVRWFGVKKPRVAVCGLNPHAGEHGVMGKEEDLVIRPVVDALQRELYGTAYITGPYAADTLFTRYRGVEPDEGPHDAVVCMYHDQGLIPLKLLHFGQAANITLGLPVLRTSVDHGTAYDIAAQGIADASSMRYAMELASELLSREVASSEDVAGGSKS